MKHMLLLTVLLSALNILQAQDGKQCDPAKEKPTRKNTKAKNGENYGTVISRDGAIDVALLPAKMQDAETMNVKITGTVNTVCKVKGCWMTADLGNGSSMRIRFKDYAFFVPKDCDGKTFYAEGTVSWNVTSVAQLQHYAEDAGKSAEEIEKITEPKRELVFLADGVIIAAK